MTRLLAAAFLAGCALDCNETDWRSRGYRDGYGGHPAQDLRIAGRCAQFSAADYMDGWRLGHDEHDRLKTMNDL